MYFFHSLPSLSWKRRNRVAARTLARRRTPEAVDYGGKMDVVKAQQMSWRVVEKVIVHPLVLLSIVDNYNRVARDTRKRVVGVLLGSSSKGTVDVTNSYAG